MMGLMEQLLLRIRMLKRISKYMTRDHLKNFLSVNSKLLYALPVFETVFGLEEYKEKNSCYTSFTMKNNQKLQVLQNKENRVLLGDDNRTSMEELIRATNSMSIQQMIAYHTVVLA